jgi:hypothetical protein
MPTKNIVPRADNEGSLGTAAKRWSDLRSVLINGKVPASVVLTAFSTATVSAGFAANTYMAGSGIAVPATGAFVAGSSYHAVFDMVKTAAGTATPIITVVIGTAGTTGDAARLTFTFGVGTAVVDTALIEVWAHFRTVGSGTAAVLVGVCTITHALAATGITTTGASGAGQIAVVSAGFDSTPANQKIGVCFNGGSLFSGTCTLVEAEAKNLNA